LFVHLKKVLSSKGTKFKSIPKVYLLALMEVEILFFNCLGFKPKAIEEKIATHSRKMDSKEAQAIRS
jgi:hypothetical protein